MGATVSTECAVSAFRSAKGNVFYIMWEKTFEKNCYPHNPRWSCVQFGGQAAVMEAIFKYSAACEGGILQGRGGHITPEGYIQRWMKAIKAPLRVPNNETFTLSMGKSFYDAIRVDQPKALEVLLEFGMESIVAGLREGKSFALPVYEHGEMLTRLQAVGVLPWRLFQHGPLGNQTDASLALDYSRAGAGRYTPPIPSMVRIEESVYIEGEDGVYRNEGWDYSIVGSFVANFWKIENAHPGSYKSAIKFYREAVKAAPKAEDMNMLVEIDANIDLQYGELNRKNLLDLLGGNTRMPLNAAMATLRQTGNAYEIPFGEKYVTLRKAGITGVMPGGGSKPIEPQAQLSLIA